MRYGCAHCDFEPVPDLASRTDVSLYWGNFRLARSEEQWRIVLPKVFRRSANALATSQSKKFWLIY